MLIGRAEQRFFPNAQNTLALADVLATQMMELGAAHMMLELWAGDDAPKEGISGQQHLVIEKDVVDAHHALLA
jgi:hypothetical protein